MKLMGTHGFDQTETPRNMGYCKQSSMEALETLHRQSYMEYY